MGQSGPFDHDCNAARVEFGVVLESVLNLGLDDLYQSLVGLVGSHTDRVAPAGIKVAG